MHNWNTGRRNKDNKAKEIFAEYKVNIKKASVFL